MQVTAFSTPAHPGWRWRICDYGGEIIEESHDRFLTIATAVAQGAERLAIGTLSTERRRLVET